MAEKKQTLEELLEGYRLTFEAHLDGEIEKMIARKEWGHLDVYRVLRLDGTQLRASQFLINRKRGQPSLSFETIEEMEGFMPTEAERITLDDSSETQAFARRTPIEPTAN